MRDHVLMLARRLFETDDLDEARGIASELQRLVREHVEELGLKHYWRKMRAASESHPAKVVEMPQNQILTVATSVPTNVRPTSRARPAFPKFSKAIPAHSSDLYFAYTKRGVQQSARTHVRAASIVEHILQRQLSHEKELWAR